MTPAAGEKCVKKRRAVGTTIQLHGGLIFEAYESYAKVNELVSRSLSSTTPRPIELHGPDESTQEYKMQPAFYDEYGGGTPYGSWKTVTDWEKPGLVVSINPTQIVMFGPRIVDGT